MESRPDLDRLIRALVDAMREYDRLAFDEEEPHEPEPPATPGQIARLERILGRPLPPSYRAFLERHNGWADFQGGARLLSVEDHQRPWVAERIRDISDLFFEDAADNPFRNGMLPVLLGEDENNYLVLDPSTVRADGEMDFVMYDYGEEEERFETFTTFLEDTLDVIEALIEDEKEGLDEEEDEDEEG